MSSSDEFIRNLTDSGLLSPEDLRDWLERHSLGQPPPDRETLVAVLTSSGTLTAYQAKAIQERNFRELIIGNYVVLERLGAGGMGTVYKARHRRMKRIVALKVLAESADQSETFVRRFLREVETIAQLSHPNIVMAHDADEAAVGHFLVMEFIDGSDLGHEVEKHGPLSVAQAVSCITQTAQALDYAHSRGIIHRDIKPHNLLRTRAGQVKVTDLGLARFSEALTPQARDQTAITQAGYIVGTVDYMSPEQALGSAITDHRADIYSLGCTLHFLLTAKPPYDGDSLLGVLFNHQHAPIPDLTKARLDVSAGLSHVFQRMIAKNPGERYQSMSEVLQGLEALGPFPTGPAPGPVEAAATNAPTRGNLPRVDSPELSPLAEPAGGTIDLSSQGLTTAVLLAEPSRTQARIIRGYLQQIGHTRVQICSRGEEVLALVRYQPPALVVAALHLPDMSGLDLAEKMRAGERLGDVPFLLISGQTEAEGLPSEQTHKVTVLRKPFDASSLQGAIARAQHRAPQGRPAELQVLIVDDSLAARGRIRRTLSGLGAGHIEEAADGAQAVVLLDAKAFDLVVCDYNMPNLDGRELIEHIRQGPRPGMPVWMVTTETDQAKLDEVRQLGVTLFAKDFPPEQVRMALEGLTGR
jgi:serine/threonine protein kinase/CheY-like chemotaxis protein